MLAFIDGFTKYLLLTYDKKIDTNNAIRVLKKIFYLFGIHNRVIVDRGRCFDNEESREYYSSQNI